VQCGCMGGGGFGSTRVYHNCWRDIYWPRALVWVDTGTRGDVFVQNGKCFFKKKVFVQDWGLLAG